MLPKYSSRFGVSVACEGLHSLVVFKRFFALPVSVGLDRFVLSCLCLLKAFCHPAIGIIAAISRGGVQPLFQNRVILLELFVSSPDTSNFPCFFSFEAALKFRFLSLKDVNSLKIRLELILNFHLFLVL